MKPYISLGFYHPKRWNARQIGHDLTSLTKQAGFLPHHDPLHGPLALKGRNWSSVALHAEVRRRTFKTNMAEGWHYDGDTTEGSKPDCWLILWASNTPTLVRYRHYSSEVEVVTEAIFQPDPYEVVAFKNLECLHKRPPKCPRMRWIFRQRAQKVHP